MRTSLPVERVVGRVLLWGGLASLMLILIGLIGYVIEGSPRVQEVVRSAHAPGRGPALDAYTTLAQLRHALARHPPDALAVAALGLMCLLATPLAGVAVAIAAFWRHGDNTYAAIATAILAMLLVSVALAATG